MNKQSIDLPSNKKFGLFFGAIFLISGLYFFYGNEQTIAVLLIALSALFIAVSLFKDDLLFPLNKLWMRLGILLGTIVSPIVLAILFFFMFTPIAIGMKIFKRDELMLKPSNADSFWKLRDQDSLSAKSFNQQF
jgi:dolichyl-phosphate-mannose--protein O-mannosyl transferase